MNPVFKDVPFPNDLNEIPVPNRLADIIRQGESKEWHGLFGFIRLSLANRISTSPKEELATLQGQIKGVEDISNFFDKILSKKV